MLKQGKISLDRRQIEIIQARDGEKVKEVNRMVEEIDQGDSNSYKLGDEEFSLVRDEIFPTQFVPLCIGEHSKESSLKLYRLQKGKYNMEMVGQRIKILYQTLNRFKQSDAQQKLLQIFEIYQLKNLINRLNQLTQHSQCYFSYFQEGKQIEKIQTWRFKHTQDKTNISYKQRQQLLKDYQLILQFNTELSNHNVFYHLNLHPNTILMIRYGRCNQFGCEYGLRIKIKWFFDLMLTHNPTQKPFQVLEYQKIILRKLLAIPEQQSARSQLDQFHYQKIKNFISSEDLIKLNYDEFYFTKKLKTNSKTGPHNQLQNKQQLEKLKQQILSLEQMAKNQLKEFKLQNTHPKIKGTTRQSNLQLWNSVEKYILSNVTQSQRQIIFNQSQTKINKQTGTVKKPEKKPAPSTSKKDTKLETKKMIKAQRVDDKNEKKLTQKQIVVEANFLASGSDLKFRPQRLMQLIQTKESILYILNTKNKNSKEQNIISCYVNAKPVKQVFNLFGSYSGDPARKSFIYREKNEKFYKLVDKNSAVGYGPDIFLSIGKLDIIIPCLGTQIIEGMQALKCVSYFPISYSGRGIGMNRLEDVEEQLNETKEGERVNELGLQKQFFVLEIDIYQIKLKAQ